MKKVKKFGRGGDIITGLGAVLVGKALYDKYKGGDKDDDYTRRVKEYGTKGKFPEETSEEKATPKREEYVPADKEELDAKKAALSKGMQYKKPEGPAAVEKNIVPPTVIKKKKDERNYRLSLIQRLQEILFLMRNVHLYLTLRKKRRLKNVKTSYPAKLVLAARALLRPAKTKIGRRGPKDAPQILFKKQSITLIRVWHVRHSRRCLKVRVRYNGVVRKLKSHVTKKAARSRSMLPAAQ
jgi:hypothetical protein